uniref:cytochrome P450 71A4-like n=1 Tax=Fragaria vesca subsp. vesca TaxID=101020 RepID=UPI0005CAFCBB|nr:PREDICTED: cytochrome P450 71A4-like [Fragaria vesca subsp. vesca]
MLSDKILQMLEFNNQTLLQPFSSLTLMHVLLLLIFLILLYKSFITSPTTKNSPPSPPKLPIIGNLHQLGSYPYRSLEALAKRFGPDLMLLHFGSVPVLVVSSPETAGEVLHTNGLVFSSRPKLIVFKKLLYDHRDVSSAPYGDYWRQMKSIFVLHLLSNKRVQSYRGVREEETKLMLRKIEQSISSSPDHSAAINLTEMFSSLTNDVSCRVAFGRKYCVGEDGEMFQELLKEFLELLGRVNIADYIPWLAWWSNFNGLNAKLDKVAKRFDDFLEGVVQEHIDIDASDSKKNNSTKGNEDKKDFVDVLLGLQKEKGADFALDRLSIKALILDVFTAGNDTHTIIDWAMSELLRHPRVMNKLQNEVRGIAGSKTMVTEDDLVGMNYLRAVIKETFRLYPTIPVLPPKVLTQHVKINGYDIKVDTQAVVNIWKINRDSKSFDNPEKFEPERFLNSSIDFKGNDFQLIPFGSGRRMCPAIQYASAIIEIALANIVHKFNWALPEGARGEHLDMTETTGLNLRRQNPLKVIPISPIYNDQLIN